MKLADEMRKLSMSNSKPWMKLIYGEIRKRAEEGRYYMKIDTSLFTEEELTKLKSRLMIDGFGFNLTEPVVWGIIHWCDSVRSAQLMLIIDLENGREPSTREEPVWAKYLTNAKR